MPDPPPSAPPPPTNQQTRKRNRVTLVCNVCKFRKVKCDRNSPCNSCIKYNTADVCSYTEPYNGDHPTKRLTPGQPSDTATTTTTTSTSTAVTSTAVSANQSENASNNEASAIPPVSNAAGAPTSNIGVNNPPTTTTTYSIDNEPIAGQPPLKQTGNFRFTGPSSSGSVAPAPPILPPLSSGGLSNIRQSSPMAANINNIRDYSTNGNRAHHSSISGSDYDNSSNGNYTINGRSITNPTTVSNSISTPASLTSPGISLEYPTHHEFSTTSKSRVFLVTKSYSDLLLNMKGGKSFVGVNPIGSPDEAINFHCYCAISEGPDHTLLNSGPLTFCAIMRLDPALADLWSFLTMKSKDFNATTEALMLKLQEQVSASTANSGVSKHFNWSNTPIQVLQRINMSAIKKFDPSEYKINDIAVPLGLNFIADEEIRDGKNIDLKLKILNVLPTKRIIWIHINRFFKFIYPFIPLLDEVSFKQHIEKLIGEESFMDEKVSEIKISENLDYAYLGILLIVLRMSYLALISNNKEVDNFNLNFRPGFSQPPPQVEIQQLTDSERINLRMLLQNSIGIEVIVLARSCLNQFQLFQKVNLIILQLALFMRMYIFVAPEDSEGPDQNQFQTFTGTLISMAYSIGLHRDPNTFTDIEMDPKTANLRRKIWFQLNYIDIFESYSYGVPLTTHSPFSDTLFPFEEATNNNITFGNLERFTIESWKIIDPICIKLRIILGEILNVNREVPLVKFVDQLNDLEIFVAKYLGSDVESFLDTMKRTGPDSEIDKYLQLYNYIQIKFFFVSIYHHLYIYYEKKGNLDLTKFYLKKILIIIVEEFLPQYGRILDSQHYYFNYAANLFLNPILESAMHRSSGFMMSLIIRLNYLIRVLTIVKRDEHNVKMEKDTDYKTYFENLEQLLYFCNKTVKLNTLLFVRLGNRYLHSWRVSKCHVYLLKAIDSDEFYTAFNNAGKGQDDSLLFKSANQKILYNFDLRSQWVEDLNEMIYGALSKLRFDGGSRVRKEWTDFYGPTTQHEIQRINKIESKLDKEGKKRPKLTADEEYQEPFDLPRFNESFSIDTPNSVNIDELFAMLSNKQSQSSSQDYDTVLDGTATQPDDPSELPNYQEDLDSVLEKYYALDDPHFEIFNKLPLDKLFDSFDGSKV